MWAHMAGEHGHGGGDAVHGEDLIVSVDEDGLLAEARVVGVAVLLLAAAGGRVCAGVLHSDVGGGLGQKTLGGCHADVEPLGAALHLPGVGDEGVLAGAARLPLALRQRVGCADCGRALRLALGRAFLCRKAPAEYMVGPWVQCIFAGSTSGVPLIDHRFDSAQGEPNIAGGVRVSDNHHEAGKDMCVGFYGFRFTALRGEGTVVLLIRRRCLGPRG
jgi:hypothetical protein